MRYMLPVDRLVNQLIPHYLSGRKLILLVQSLLHPLVVINKEFEEFAKTKQIEARMTSQIIYFEWFLSRKFRPYFRDSKEGIIIQESESKAIEIWHEEAENSKPYTIWYEGEQIPTGTSPEYLPKPFYHKAEEKLINQVSFIVLVPEITINQQEFVYMLKHTINTYKIAGKTYLIKISHTQ